MKQLLMTLAVCLTGFACIGPAAAQSRNTMTLTLPHAITFGTVSLPAGDCTITNIAGNGRESAFLVYSSAGPAFYIRMDRAEQFDNRDTNATEIQLRRAGDTYEVQGIRMEGKGYRLNQF